MKIGEIAKKAGCQVVTVRYYEKEGLLGETERSKANYRLYTEKDLERLNFIRSCRVHGMSLAEIKDLLAFRDNPTDSCEWVGDLVQKHIDNVEAQIESLNHLKAHLVALHALCDNGGSCGIINCLNQGTPCLVRQHHGENTLKIQCELYSKQDAK